MKHMVLKVVGLSVALGVVWVLGSFASAPAEAESILKTIQKRGKLLAGVRFDYPPNGYIDKDGNNIGYGPDVAREFAKHLGVDIEFIQTRSKTRIPMLLNGTIDADIGPTTPHKVRDEVVDFSYTYVWDRSIIMVREGMSKEPEDYYNDTKTVVGSIQGSNFVSLWQQRAPNANMKLYQEYPDLVVALSQGKVDIAVISEITAFQMIDKLGDRGKGLVVGNAFLSDPQAIGLPENDSNWRDWVNWALQRLWAEGKLQALYKKHYKMDPPFHIWENGQLQPRVTKIAKERDPW